MIQAQLHNETEILKQVANGNERSFRLLFDHYRDGIYSFAYKVFDSEAMAEEVVQETFVKVWVARSSLPGVDNFSSWLFIFCRNSAFNMLRRMARQRRLTIELQTRQQTEGFSEDLIIEKEYKDLLQQAIDNLPPQQKLVYNMSRENGLKREEIATLLNLSPETVKAHLALALKHIRTYVSNYDSSLLSVAIAVKLFF